MKNNFSLRIKKFILVLILLSLIGLSSCTKAGKGGKSTIEGLTKHHTRIIPFTTVYIKYNTQQLPGTDPSNFNDNVVSDSQGNYKFSGLEKGNYFLFGIGFDSAISLPVRGGLPITIKKNGDVVNTDVPITEL